MAHDTKRGYQPKDEQQLKGEQFAKLKQAADEVQFLLDRGYPIKTVTTFVGNHYMFSERQRLALARGVCSDADRTKRSSKSIPLSELSGRMVHIDGFNTIITLEVALSGSPVIFCRDETVRDLAGLRGTYHIIGITEKAVLQIFSCLGSYGVAQTHWYLDAPVSNSGRLKILIQEIATKLGLSTAVEVINDVDRVLETKSNVVTSDAIILNRCESWINLNRAILEEESSLLFKVSL